MAITGHFFDDSLNLHSIILSFRVFKERHFGIIIQDFIKSELIKMNIYEKCVAVITDNESCMVKACKTLGNKITWISCICHNLNLVIVNSLKLWSKVLEVK